MNWHQHVRELLRDVTGDAARDEEIVDEVADYLAQRHAEWMAAGLSDDDARQRTLLELRARPDLARALRRADRPRPLHPTPPPSSGPPAMLSDLVKDVRYGGRLLVRSPGFSLAAALTLALGIGATTAIFSVVNAVLLRPVPFANQDGLVMVWETDRNSGTTREPASYPDYLDFRERSRQMAAFAAFIGGEITHTPAQGEPARLAMLGVTSDFFTLLGLTPAAGRRFTAGDEARPGEAQSVVISDRLWERLFERRADAIGAAIRLDDRERTVIGVMPRDADFGTMQILNLAAYGRGFADRDARSRVDVWVPLRGDPQQWPRSTHPIFVVGRLAQAATAATAQQELAGIMSALEAAYPENRARGANVERVTDVVFGRVKPALWVLLSSVAVVLLIACVNVANLLLARGTVRLREVAVRTALGAPVRRLARQFAAETLVLTLGAAVIGVLLAFAGLRLLLVLAPADIPRLASVTMDGRVLFVALVVAIVSGFIFGLLPVAQARRLDLQSALKAEDSRTGSAAHERGILRSTLVVAEVALAVVLVIGAGLLIKSFWRLQRVDPGFDARGVVKAEFQLPSTRYPSRNWPNFVEMHRFNGELLRSVHAIAGVTSAALAGNHPLDAGFTNSWVLVGRESESTTWPEISIRRVTPGYFRTVSLPLKRGRLLSEIDGTLSPAVGVINETVARRFFEGRDPLGQQIRFWGAARTIVGVVADERIHGLTASSPPAIYLPLAQAPSFGGGEVLLVRTSGSPEAVTGEIRAAISGVDRGLAVFGVEPLERTVSESIGQRRFVMLLLLLFAVLALTLAAIGIHGVLSYTVALRRHEIGIRMALGAAPARVTRQVLAHGMRLTGLGLLLGLGGALLVMRLLTSLVFGVSTRDAATMAVAIPILAGVALLAAYLPARRAVRTDPLAALRE